MTAPLQTYVDLHRHAAVRAKLVEDTGLALRVLAAHAIGGSSLWRLAVEPQRAGNDAIAESVETCASETAFDAHRAQALAWLAFDPDTPHVTGGYRGGDGLAALLETLRRLSDEQVLSILGVVMAETLEAGSSLIEHLGVLLGIDMARCWQADDALLSMLRDREVVHEMLAEVAGRTVADAQGRATGATKRALIADCLAGANGRDTVAGWVPRWMRFPPSAYTARGEVPSVTRAARIAADMAGRAACIEASLDGDDGQGEPCPWPIHPEVEAVPDEESEDDRAAAA